MGWKGLPCPAKPTVERTYLWMFGARLNAGAAIFAKAHILEVDDPILISIPNADGRFDAFAAKASTLLASSDPNVNVASSLGTVIVVTQTEN